MTVRDIIIAALAWCLLAVLAGLAISAVMQGSPAPLVVSNEASGEWDFNEAAVLVGAATPSNRAAQSAAKLPAWRLYGFCPVTRRNVPTLPDERTA